MRRLLQLFSRGFNWDRYLAWARVGIGLLAALSVVREPGYSLLFAAALVAFTAYSLMVALRPPARQEWLRMVELSADTLLFLVVAYDGVGYNVWLPSIVFLYLIATLLAGYGPREIAVVAVIGAIFCLLSGNESMEYLARTVIVGGIVAFAFATTKGRLNARVEELAAHSVAARAEANAARETERQRIASDFHDGPLQSFISLQMRLEIVRKLLDRDLQAGMHELQVVQDLAKSQVRELRAFLHSMRPLEVDGGNLSISARRVIDNFQKESGIPVTLMGGDASLCLSQEIMAEVLQMLREALHNVQKHAAASRVAVSIQKADKVIEISVDDNGRGFYFSGAYTLEELELLQVGPASLKRRARSLNADLVLESRPGQGAGLKMRIPA